MQGFVKYMMVLITIIGLSGCKQKKKISLAGEDSIVINEFIEFFPKLDLPFQFADTNFQATHKENDSLLISQKIFKEFVPDSVLKKSYTKNQKIKIYVIGKVAIPKAETYLFIKILTSDKNAVFILVFDNEEKFMTAMPVLKPDSKTVTEQSVYMDSKYSITKTTKIKNADGTLSEGKDVYIFNSDTKRFALIMTDALDDKLTELINPIDTLPRNSKYAGDYSNGKMNIVSIRDGKRDEKISFFIHVEKSNGACIGDIKGEATMTSPTTAVYQEAGEPCKLNFMFSKSAVTLKEIEGCGSRRSVNCIFDGIFAKKKILNNIDKLK